MTLRRKAAAVMQDKASIQPVLGAFCQQMRDWLQQYPDLFNPVNSSSAVLAVTHLAKKAQTLAETTQISPGALALNAALLQKIVSEISSAEHRSLCNVLWAFARLSIRPDDLMPGCEEALMDRVLDTSGSATLQGASSVLWSCSALGINPGNGVLIRSCLETIERSIKTTPLPLQDMQSMSMTMCALAHMRLHIKPALAELMVTKVYLGLLQGMSAPLAIANILWACATLGYAPQGYMLQRFKQSYASSTRRMSAQHDSTVGWSLAVLGALDMSFFTRIVLRTLHSSPHSDKNAQMLYQALQSWEDVRLLTLTSFSYVSICMMLRRHSATSDTCFVLMALHGAL